MEISCQVTTGMPNIHVVGIPAGAAKALITRLTGAFASVGIRFPTRRTFFCFSPELQYTQELCGVDLAAAIAYLLASRELSAPICTRFLCFGGLKIDGSVISPTLGEQFKSFFVQNTEFKSFMPLVLSDSLSQEQLISGSSGVESLEELMFRIKNDSVGRQKSFAVVPEATFLQNECSESTLLRLDQIKGHANAKRMLMIAAAGAHHLLLAGPPGLGKSLLAACVPGLLPALEDRERNELAGIYARVHRNPPLLPPLQRPVIASTRAALLGSAQSRRPGELGLAHAGVLHLEECLEWSRSSLEVFRQVLECGFIEARGPIQQTPARFLLVATTNLCPCGMRGHKKVLCRCSGSEIQRYQRKLSQPFLDRIPLRLALSAEENSVDPGPSAAQMLMLVRKAQERMRARQKYPNERMDADRLQQILPWSKDAEQVLHLESENYSLRALDSLRRVASTITDLAGLSQVNELAVREALFFRRSIFNDSLGWARGSGARKYLGQAFEGGAIQ